MKSLITASLISTAIVVSLYTTAQPARAYDETTVVVPNQRYYSTYGLGGYAQPYYGNYVGSGFGYGHYPQSGLGHVIHDFGHSLGNFGSGFNNSHWYGTGQHGWGGGHHWY